MSGLQISAFQMPWTQMHWGWDDGHMMGMHWAWWIFWILALFALGWALWRGGGVARGSAPYEPTAEEEL